MEPLKYCRNVADVKTLWYGEVVSKNRYPHLRIRHRRADAEHIRPETNPIPVSFRMEEYIMKKLSKRFLTLAIACVMAMAMAVPTFAAAPKRAAYAGVTYTILSKSNGLYASAQDGTNVQLASYAQKWTPVNDGGTIKLFRGTGNASKRVATYDKGEVILQASTCDYQVASIDFRTVSGQVHRIISTSATHIGMQLAQISRPRGITSLRKRSSGQSTQPKFIKGFYVVKTTMVNMV